MFPCHQKLFPTNKTNQTELYFHNSTRGLLCRPKFLPPFLNVVFSWRCLVLVTVLANESTMILVIIAHSGMETCTKLKQRKSNQHLFPNCLKRSNPFPLDLISGALKDWWLFCPQLPCLKMNPAQWKTELWKRIYIWVPKFSHVWNFTLELSVMIINVYFVLTQFKLVSCQLQPNNYSQSYLIY